MCKQRCSITPIDQFDSNEGHLCLLTKQSVFTCPGYTIQYQVSQTFLHRQSYPMDRGWEGNDGTNEWLQRGRSNAMTLDGTVEMGYGESADYTVVVH